MLRSALLAAPDFLPTAMQPGTVSILRVPDAAWGRSIGKALDLVVEALNDTAGAKAHPTATEWPATIHGPDQFLVFEAATRPAHNVEVFRDAVGRGTAVHVISHDPDTLVAADILLAEEGRLVVLPPCGAVLKLLGSVLETDACIPLAQLPAASGPSPEGMDLSPLLVNLAHRKGQRATAFLNRLRMLAERHRTRRAAANQPPTLTLDDLPGQGDATVWGRQLVADLGAYARGALDWSDVDRGVVLEGPPGSGKSSYARALAGSAGVPLICASLAQWQGSRDGHLGHLLSSMRASFDEARRKAPCILLLDEIDSFPNRASVTHRHKDYVIEVVNGLLEQLDGAIGRAGVVVVGTCNDSSNLDPAMTRAGRLERIIRLDRPDACAIERILRVHLRGALRTEDLMPVARMAALRGAVGADIERWCRGARRRARSADHPMDLADLVEEFGPASEVHTPEAVRRMAVHEAGHVLAFSMLGTGAVQQVVVDPTVGGLSRTTVDIAGPLRSRPHVTREDVSAQLRAVLAGRAAEEVLLGVPSSGAGGSSGSDLAHATGLASSLVLSSGLDDHPHGLLFLAPVDDGERVGHLLLVPEIRERIGAVLSQAYAEALDLVREHRDAVEHVAAALIQRGHLSGSEVESMLALRTPGSGVQDDPS
jgi:hypothetical protein